MLYDWSTLQLHHPVTAIHTVQHPPTFRRVPVDKGVHQRPAFAVVGGSQLQPISFESADYLAFPGNTHGERPLMVLTGQRVQRSTAWCPGVKENQQPQIWRKRKAKRADEEKYKLETLVNNIQFGTKAKHLHLLLVSS